MESTKGKSFKISSYRDILTASRPMQIIGWMVSGLFVPFVWLTWGMAIYWMRGGSVPAESCAVAGAIVSAVLSLISRRLRGFTLFLLPIFLAVFFGR